MDKKTVIFEKKDSVGVITLNRPERNNAISSQLAAELKEIRDEIGWDSGIRVIILKGEGANFSVGTDPEAYSAYENREEFIGNMAVASTISSLTQPTIAAIHGDTLGQGLELALGCDLRIASDIARFAMPQVTNNEIPFDGGTQRLPRLIGRTNALEFIFQGQTIESQEALRIGLIGQVVPAEELMPAAFKWADDLSAKGPIAMRFAKEAIMHGMDMTLEQGLRLEADLYFLLHSTKDRVEGITAFQEKREPEFEEK